MNEQKKATRKTSLRLTVKERHTQIDEIYSNLYVTRKKNQNKKIKEIFRSQEQIIASNEQTSRNDKAN